jgi:hypothetical protein
MKTIKDVMIHIINQIMLIVNRKNILSLVGSVVIIAELGREDYGLISHNCNREEAETT